MPIKPKGGIAGLSLRRFRSGAGRSILCVPPAAAGFALMTDASVCRRVPCVRAWPRAETRSAAGFALARRASEEAWLDDPFRYPAPYRAAQALRGPLGRIGGNPGYAPATRMPFARSAPPVTQHISTPSSPACTPGYPPCGECAQPSLGVTWFAS